MGKKEEGRRKTEEVELEGLGGGGEGGGWQCWQWLTHRSVQRRSSKQLWHEGPEMDGGPWRRGWEGPQKEVKRGAEEEGKGSGGKKRVAFDGGSMGR